MKKLTAIDLPLIKWNEGSAVSSFAQNEMGVKLSYITHHGRDTSYEYAILPARILTQTQIAMIIGFVAGKRSNQ